MRDGRVWPGMAALALAVALAACGGAEVAPTPAPATVTATPTAVPTPATVATTATPSPTPTAAADPFACTSRALGGARVSSPELADDCDTLLAIKATLEGTATLNWSADTALTAWEGVTVSGDPKRVTRIVIPGGARSGKLDGTLPAQLGSLTALTALDLSGNALGGSIPAQLDEITALANLAISGNSFTGCIPNALWSVADKDLADVGLADCSAPITLPDDFSQDFPRGAGTYRIVERLDAIIFNVPEGASILWWDVEYGDCFGHQGSCYPSIILRDEHSGSDLCLDSVTAEECGRYVVSADGASGQQDTARINKVFDRIANSARPEPRPAPAPVVIRYSAPQADGVVDAPGEYAFFSADGPVTTYEGLRQDVERLVIHERDADGASWAAFYDAVEAGDDFEWREADDCWVRYLVDEVLPDPADAPLKALAVRWITYAYTGCSGTVPATGDRMWIWAPPNIQSPDITVPVRHGIWLLLPPAYWNRLDWESTDGIYEERIPLPGSSQATGTSQPEVSTDLAVVQQHPLWRTPKLPAGWQLNWAISGSEGIDGYQAVYNNERGGIGIEIHIYRPQFYPQEVLVSGAQGSSIAEVQTIDDHQAIVKYSPSGSAAQTTAVWLFDATAEIAYVVVGIDGTVRGTPDAITAIARSLFEEPAPVVMRYGAPQTDGIVDAPGEYAFFSADGPVTTYEGLRQDVERLVIHERDADGASWAAFYAEVEAGDDFEWREADDCWVRYLVDEVLPDPTDAPLKVLAVRWITYAYTGCSGALAMTGGRMWTWAPPNIRGPEVTVPVRHGPVLLIPSGWSGDIEEPVRLNPQAVGVEESATGAGAPTTFSTTELAEARTIPLWRDVTLPFSDWRFVSAQAGTYDSPPYGHGFQADYGTAQGGVAVSVMVGHMQVVPGHATAHYPGNTISIQETRIIDGYPALVLYNPDGKSPLAPTSVMIYDEENGIVYAAYGYIVALIGSNISPLIEIARSLYAEPAPVVMRYGAPQTDGIVDAPGEYAFFSADGPITTYEGLRQDVERLVIHERDADGASWAAFYAGVEAGDDFEWREADDCWVRYLVDEVLPTPTDAPLKALAVRWITYAYTGCSGAISATGDRMWTWAPPNIQFTHPSAVVTSPVRHGPWLLVPPAYWQSAVLESQVTYPINAMGSAGGAQASSALVPDVMPTVTSDIAVARRLPLWREPVLPADWLFVSAEAGTDDAPLYGYTAYYRNGRNYSAAVISVWYRAFRPDYIVPYSNDSGIIYETRNIDGHPAIVLYSPMGPHHDRYISTLVCIFIEESGIEYRVLGRDRILKGSNIEGTIEIARSLYADPAPVVMRYGAPQLDGIVDAPGEYAFFSTDGPITTHEGLRQDVERLVIHERDADGASWAAFYDAVAAGDDFEWREADDCWVRYLVDEVLPDPTDAPLKALAVRRYSYAYTGCSGALATTGDRMWTWAPLNIQSPDMTVPVRHGIWLLLPPAYWNSLDWEGTDGVYEERIPLPGSSQATDASQPEVSTDLAVVQQHPLWRTPELPDGWTLTWGGIGLEGIDGYHVIYRTPRGGIGVDIYVERPRWHPQKLLIDSRGTSVFETRTIDGHFSIIQYSPTGENHYPIMVAIFDESSGISYTVVGNADTLGSDLSAVISVARSLYLEEDQP